MRFVPCMTGADIAAEAREQLRLGSPVMLNLVLQTCSHLVGIFVVGHLGAEFLAGSGAWHARSIRGRCSRPQR